MKQNALAFFKEEDAQAMVEYILVTCVLMLASYGAVRLFMHAWRSKFNMIKNTRSYPWP